MHEDIHNNTPRFRCIYCQYASTNIGHFSNHMSAHYGESEYKCNICGLVARSHGDLKIHMDIHSGTKYKCTFCSTICQTKQMFYGHASKHHNIHEEVSKYRVTIEPEVTEKDMKEMFPNRTKAI